MVEAPAGNLKLLPGLGARKHSLGHQVRLRPSPAANGGRKFSLDPLMQPRDLSQLIGKSGAAAAAGRTSLRTAAMARLSEEESDEAAKGGAEEEEPRPPPPLPMPSGGGQMDLPKTKRKPKGKEKKAKKPAEPERGIFDDLLLPMTSPASSSSSGYSSLVSAVSGAVPGAGTAAKQGGKTGGAGGGLLFTKFLPPGAAQAAGLQSFAPTPAESEESESEEEEEEENGEDDIQLQGELAIDLFIDPLNPTGKAAHSSLTSKIKEQEQMKELRTEEIRRRQVEEKERIKIEKECSGL
jgi:hypothetical protein